MKLGWGMIIKSGIHRYDSRLIIELFALESLTLRSLELMGERLGWTKP